LRSDPPHDVFDNLLGIRKASMPGRPSAAIPSRTAE